MGSDDRTVHTVEIDDTRWEEWDEASENLGFGSVSEFIRAQVAAGRRYFEHNYPLPMFEQRSMKRRVKQIIQADEDEYTDWETIIESLTREAESVLEETLDDLQESGELDFSPRENGYKYDGD